MLSLSLTFLVKFRTLGKVMHYDTRDERGKNRKPSVDEKTFVYAGHCV